MDAEMEQWWAALDESTRQRWIAARKSERSRYEPGLVEHVPERQREPGNTGRWLMKVEHAPLAPRGQSPEYSVYYRSSGAFEAFLAAKAAQTEG